MTGSLNTQGSTWNRWDLHIHSPYSILHNEFNNDWDSYIDRLNDLEDIKAVGITDYYSIDGYKEVKKYKEDGFLNNIELILPNIELRLNISTTRDRPVNFHVIFNSEVSTDDIEDKFLRELEFEYNHRKYKCEKSDLIKLGENFVSEKDSEETALRCGMEQFKVSMENIKNIFKRHSTIFKNNYITIVPNSSEDGNSGIRDNQFVATRREIYRFADFIFSGNPQDKNFFLGKNNYSETIEQCGKLMPCVHGSDAHSLESMGKPNYGRHTWIKAETTFRGLKQLVHEPEQRVVIQPHHPENKNNYNIISKVNFQDNSCSLFNETDIEFNPGLNTIIGGKSSGKSLLLYKIAQAISEEEVNLREKDYLWKNPYTKTFINEQPFNVTWRNEENSNTNSENNSGKVTYLPQMYINSLSEDSSNEVLQEKIKSILLEDENHYRFLKEKNELLTVTRNKIEQNITNLFESLQKRSEINNSIEEIGDKKSIEKEVNRLNSELQEKVKQSKLTEEEELKVEQVQTAKKSLQEGLKNLEASQNKISNLSKKLQSINEQVNESLNNNEIYDENDQNIMFIIKNLQENIGESFSMANLKLIEEKNKYSQKGNDYDEKLKQVNEELHPLIEKMNNREEIEQLRKNLEKQNEYVNKITSLEDELGLLEENIIKLCETIINSKKEYMDIQKSIASYFQSIESLNGINVYAYLTFNKENFNEKFLSQFMRKGKIDNIFDRNYEMNIFNDEERFIFEEQNHINKIKYLFDTTLEITENKLKKNYNKRSLIHALFEPYIEVKFDLYKDHDIISEMSPGKRGLVLLELFLDINNENHPILIDQPEDNLDNRTISQDLVNFIRKKSLERQIIIVTHNANLVVLTDAENVIVANQDPQLKENENRRFEYFTGALECDFINEENTNKLLSKGIKSHVCEILEGGKEAFELRERKYGFN
ncbi:TrlF family AAA-like ATPase [Salibacterium lacus]|uniref:TrlF family AAA-like ATPase n=1 Tax=Salibacterium lacus TaxID=1898109 RepID=A0ABW5T6E4_9BACI